MKDIGREGDRKRKIRVNITVDADLLGKAKKKLHLFGGKLSTLFNAYLGDFVDSMEKEFSEDKKMLSDKIKDLEKRLKSLEDQR